MTLILIIAGLSGALLGVIFANVDRPPPTRLDLFILALAYSLICMMSVWVIMRAVMQ